MRKLFKIASIDQLVETYIQKRKGNRKRRPVKGKKSPAVQVLKISNGGELYLSFNNDMIFPNNFIEILNDKNLMTNSTEAKVVTKKRSMAQEKSNNSLLTLKMINY